jgi:hypothetical protein
MPACRPTVLRPAPASSAPSRVPGLAALVTLTIAAVWVGHPAAQANDAPCQLHTSERVVAIGDVHGAYDGFVQILQAAGLVDRRQRWSGGRAVLVQTGDVLDRGPDSRRVLDLLRRLERDASRAGGRVHALLGNHEVMRMVGDWRYVSDREYAAFRNASSADMRDRVYEVLNEQAAERARAEGRRHDEAAYRKQFLEEIPLGFLEMRLAFSEDGDYGRWLRTRPAVINLNGIVFVHGGISPDVAAIGCERINETVRRELTGPPPEPERLLELLSSSEHGPLWYRGLAQEPEDEFAPTLDSILRQMDARAIVVGHTPASGGIATRFGGRVIQIDTGMLGGEFYPRGVPSALEIQGGVFTVIYSGHRERLSVPALEAAMAPRAAP